MTRLTHKPLSRLFKVFIPLISGLFFLAVILILARSASDSVRAAPIEPPEGYPKFNISTKVVTPTLVDSSGETLQYIIDLINTGAYTATGTTFTDVIPDHTTYNGDAWSSSPPLPTYSNGALNWVGTVGFDSSVRISFTVNVSATYKGVVSNTAIIDHPLIAHPVTLTTDAMVTNDPYLYLEKVSIPEMPGANKPMTYRLLVENRGQPAFNMPVSVVDELPSNTTFRDADPSGSFNGTEIIWTRAITLGFGENTVFTYSVDIADVPSGTVINNENYFAEYLTDTIAVGEPYTVTVVDPILFLSKDTWPHPPGSNRELTYTITVLNTGSQATDLVITDTVPTGVNYVRGGSYSNGIVSWYLPFLDTNESETFTFTVFIEDIADVPVLNQSYSVCALEEEVCVRGEPLTSTVGGPSFEVTAELDPIAKKPGGGTGPVTPTLTVKNLGPGNALDAVALLYFGRISVSNEDVIQVIPDKGLLTKESECGENCRAFKWVGDIAYNEVITFTVYEGQSTIGGEPETHYTSTIVVTDTLGDYVTEPITATAIGKITHFANLLPRKDAPAEIGAGQEMTYTITVFNSGLSTDEPPNPTLSETVPASVTLVSASDDYELIQSNDQTIISWTLPAMGPGERVYRNFKVLVGEDLISGTKIVNDDYKVTWFDIGANISETGFLSNTGEPITTVVREIGLIDSFKEVTPTLARPGPGNVLTYVVNIVNSSPVGLSGVRVYDYLPWQSSTYQRDAVVSSGQVSSDIVSISWLGNVGAYSSERITMTVLVDEDFEGPITNTAVIKHPSLKEDLEVHAVAYITNDPVLFIRKFDNPDPVKVGNALQYTIRVQNLGQQATQLVVTDTIPMNTSYVDASAGSGGKLINNIVTWEFPVLEPGKIRKLIYQVEVLGGDMIVNNKYGVICDEGVSATGPPVYTTVIRATPWNFLPIILK